MIHKTEGSEWKKTLADGTEVIRTCAFSPPGCHAVGCGLKLFVKDGILIKVEGDPEHPITKGRLCVRCLSLKEYIYHPNRILYPQRRVGERGENTWERITWEEAYDEIMTKTKALQAEFGPECAFTLCGTGREGVRYQYPLTAGILNSPNICYSQSGWSCMGPRDTASKCLMGSGYPEMDYGGGLPGWLDNPNYVLPKYIVVWGKEPLKSNPDGLWGHSLIQMMKRGTKLIVADPKVTWLASRAEHVLQLRPGTDTALALGILNVIINEKLYDQEWVDKWTYGFDELVERVQQFPPAWAAAETDVPEELIIEVARILGTVKPWTLTMGLATDQNPNGVQLVHSLFTISAITGNLDCPGGTLIGEILNLDFGGTTSEALQSAIILPEELANKVIGQDEYPMLGILLNTTHPDLTLDALETGKPYSLKMVWISSTNLIAPTNSSQPNRWLAAMRKLDFIVATDTFMNPTIMALADIVLPLSTFAEHEGIVMTYQGSQAGIIGALNKAITVGECKSDLEIMLEFGKKANPEKFTMYADNAAYLNKDLAPYGLTYEQLHKDVVVLHEIPYYKYEKGLIRSDGEPGFNTTTGKFEIHSTLYEVFGEDPLPYYERPRFGPLARPDLAKEYPLTMTTGAKSYTYFHSEHRQIKTLREIRNVAYVEIHPDTAKGYGIQDGEWVVLENMWGKATMKVKLTPIIRRDTVAADHGWWYPEQEASSPSLYGVWEANVNTMIPHKEIGKLGFGNLAKSIPCKIYKSDYVPQHDWQNMY